MIFFSLFLVSDAARAQEVGTFFTGLDAFDGLAFDADGNLLATKYSFPGTGFVYKITPDGDLSVWLSGVRGAAGVVLGPDGFIYVAEYNSNTVLRVTPGGTASVFASGLAGPIGLDFDSAGNLYIQNFNTPIVHRVSPAGVSEVFAFVTGLVQGSAIAIDDEDNVFVTAYRQGAIYRVTPDGVSSVFASGGSPGYGFIRWGDGQLYLTGIRDHRIYSLCPDTGCAPTVLAGTGVPGYLDGPAETAQFDTPLGLAIQSTEDGDVLYLGDTQNVAFRTISPDAPASAEDSEVVEGTRPRFGLQALPNPFPGSTRIRYQLPAESRVELTIYSATGQVVRSLGATTQGAGTHEVEWDGSDEQGQAMPRGTYFSALTVNGLRTSGTLVKLR